MRSWPAPVAAVAMLLASMLAGSRAVALPVRPGMERPDPSPLTDRFSLRGSVFFSNPSTQLRLDSSGGTTTGTTLSAEDDFGQDDSIQQGQIEVTFRTVKRNKLRVNYFKLDRYGDTTLARTINFGNTTYNANDRVVTSLDLRTISFTDTYSLFQSEKLEIAFGLGLHGLEVDLRGQVPARSTNDEASAAGVLPTLAMDTAWRISQRFALTARGQYFSTRAGNDYGLFADFHTDVQFRWRPNLAFGLGYSRLRLTADVQSSNFPGRFSLKVGGPEAFVSVSF